jgi:hypothetical protein
MATIRPRPGSLAWRENGLPDGRRLAGGREYFDVHPLDTGDAAQSLLDIAFDLPRDLRAATCQLQRNAGRPAFDGNLLDQAKGNHIPGVAGVFHRLERVEDGLLGQNNHDLHTMPGGALWQGRRR